MTSNNQDQFFGKSAVGPVPIHFAQFKLNDDVLHYLQEDQLFDAPESEVESLGYCKAVDYPDIEQHKYYEAYMHSLPIKGSFRSMHSRYGYEFDKPRAPLRLVAFCEALRRVNTAWRDAIIAKLSAQGPASVPASTMIAVLQQNRHFSDLSVQLHFGDEVPHARAAFHNDGPNSIVHVALSVRGRRSLLWKGSTDPDTVWEQMGIRPRRKPSKAPELAIGGGGSVFRRIGAAVSSLTSRDRVSEPQQEPAPNEASAIAPYTTFEERQSPGSVYISSPFAVTHAVAYPATYKAKRTTPSGSPTAARSTTTSATSSPQSSAEGSSSGDMDDGWADRIVAVQCRILFTPAEVAALRQRPSDGAESPEAAWISMMEVITSSLKAGTAADEGGSLTPTAFRMPTLDDVKSVVSELEREENV